MRRTAPAAARPAGRWGRPLAPQEPAIRIKVVSDIHGAAAQLRREAADADALLVCGDLVNLLDYLELQGPVVDVFGEEAVRRFVELRTASRFEEAGLVLRCAAAGREDEVSHRIHAACREQLAAVFEAFPERTYLTHGNVDTPAMWAEFLRPGLRHLDGEAVDLDGLTVGFVGGGLPRGARPHLAEVTEAEFARKVAGLPRVDVLCSHMPPAVDDLRFDVVAGRFEPGSQALLDYVEEQQPDYLYFGHVHQPRASRMRVGRTRLVNVGYFRGTGRMLVHPAD
jgi:Icc-related predicted phosphoesterase